jgi:hypothetical protein
MSKKLRLKDNAGKEESLIDLEEARDWDFADLTRLVVVERELVRSYEELLALAQEDRFKDKEALEVYFMMTLSGGSAD